MSGLSIIVVSWETRALTLCCLESAGAAARQFENQTGVDAEVILVDNGSGDGTVEAVRAEEPSVVVVALDANRGFAHAVNRGAALAVGEVLLLLNSDATVDVDALRACWSALADRADLAIVGPRLVHPDGRLQHAAHAFPGLVDELVPAPLLDVLWPERRPAKQRIRGLHPVDAVQGAAFFVRSEAFRRLGGLDEGFFFFLEETDLCWRARASGLGVAVVEAARVTHLGGASSKRIAPARTRIEYHRSLYRFLRLRRGAGVAAWARFIRTVRGALVLPVLAAAALVDRDARARLDERTRLLRWHLAGAPDGGGLSDGWSPPAAGDRPAARVVGEPDRGEAWPPG